MLPPCHKISPTKEQYPATPNACKNPSFLATTNYTPPNKLGRYFLTWVFVLTSDKLSTMVLEIDRRTIFPYPIYEEPDSYPYNARVLIERIFYLTDPNNIFRYAAMELYDKATKNSENDTEVPEIGAEMWNNPHGLINRFISVEETRITDQTSWQTLKKILIKEI